MYNMYVCVLQTLRNSFEDWYMGGGAKLGNEIGGGNRKNGETNLALSQSIFDEMSPFLLQSGRNVL